MQEFFTAIGIVLGIILVGFFADFGRRDIDGSGVSSDKDSARRVDTGITDSKERIDTSAKRIAGSTENIDSSIKRLKDTIAILDNAKKRNTDLSDK